MPRRENRAQRRPGRRYLGLVIDRRNRNFCSLVLTGPRLLQHFEPSEALAGIFDAADVVSMGVCQHDAIEFIGMAKFAHPDGEIRSPFLDADSGVEQDGTGASAYQVGVRTRSRKGPRI